MLKIKQIIFFMSILLVLSSCSKHHEDTKSIQVLIKNNNIKINDSGFLYTGTFYQTLEVFKLTQKILKLQIDKKQICLNDTCYLKKDFNKYFFGAFYYDELIEDIINLEPIFKKSNIEHKDDCFTQNIQTKTIDISYKVCDNFVYFKDNKYNSIIKFIILH